MEWFFASFIGLLFGTMCGLISAYIHEHFVWKKSRGRQFLGFILIPVVVVILIGINYMIFKQCLLPILPYTFPNAIVFMSLVSIIFLFNTEVLKKA